MKNNSLCYNCENEAEHNHHIIPKVMGGLKTIPLCQVCHDKAHDVKRTSISYLTKYGIAKNKSKIYIQVFGFLIYEFKSLTQIQNETKLSETKLIKIINNLYNFNWDELYVLLGEPYFKYNNIIFNKEKLYNDWNFFKNIFKNFLEIKEITKLFNSSFQSIKIFGYVDKHLSAVRI